MYTSSDRELRLRVADQAMAFAGTFEAWVRRASQSAAGESVARLKLLYELHCHGPRKMADLADALAVTPRNVTALVDGLETEHQVRRVQHPTDRRVTMIELTGGAAEVEAQMETLRTRVAVLFEGLDPSDLAAFQRVLDRVGPQILADLGHPAEAVTAG